MNRVPVEIPKILFSFSNPGIAMDFVKMLKIVRKSCNLSYSKNMAVHTSTLSSESVTILSIRF